MSYDLFAGVTTQTIEYIADAVFTDERGRRIKLREKDGSPKIKACMYALGFNINSEISTVLREEKEIKDRISSVLIRNPNQPSQVQEVTVYAGKRRENYNPPEGLHPWLSNIGFDGSIMHVFNKGVSKSIQEFGNDY